MLEAKHKSGLKLQKITAVILLLLSPFALKLHIDHFHVLLFFSVTCSFNVSVSLQILSCSFPCFHFCNFYFAAQTILSPLSTHTAHQVLYDPFAPLLGIHWCGSDTRNKSLRNNKLLAKPDLPRDHPLKFHRDSFSVL